MAQNGRTTPGQEALIAALLAGQKIEAAAKTANISERTAYRWQKSPAFQAALKTAQHTLFNEKLNILKAGVGVALFTLQRNMSDKGNAPASTQVRAAQIWLEQAIALHKMTELEQRLVEIETRMKEQRP